MKKNDNIYIGLQIQKDQASNTFLLNVIFDRQAPNFSTNGSEMSWYPTPDEITIVTEAFHLIQSYQNPGRTIREDHEPPAPVTPPDPAPYRRSSEMRIAPLPEESAEEDSQDDERVPMKKQATEEQIFKQADEKTIDEILKKKRNVIGEDPGIESSDKSLIDRMLKQKKKKD
ncbi:MAG: hypothetical protein JXA00_05610 [Candidatus Thermoplasmatota archaeon]|nr:hypothetical protein [Candidatus Thermoplasmatota archaeon]